MSTEIKILELVKQLPELYQDIELDNKLIAKGRRECLKRWEVIKNYIKPNSVIMDLGSAEGYFSHKIAKKYPNSLVVSFESDPDMCRIQKAIYREEGIYNIVVCNHRLSKADLEHWTRYVDCFDIVLALSVFHHYPPEEVERVFNYFEKLAPVIMGDTTATGEDEACGGETKEIINKILKVQAKTIGGTPSHLGNYQRSLWIKRTSFKKQQIIERYNLDAYFGVNHEGRHKFKLIWDQVWKLNNKHIIPGINLHNLLHFNIVWPEKKWFKAQIYGAYYGLEYKTDVRLWNVLFTTNGLKAIDYKTEFPKGDQAEYRIEDLKNIENLLDYRLVDLEKGTKSGLLFD